MSYIINPILYLSRKTENWQPKSGKDSFLRSVGAQASKLVVQFIGFRSTKLLILFNFPWIILRLRYAYTTPMVRVNGSVNRF